MAGFVCSEHAGEAALFSCEGCARLLCQACVKEGHRLYFCAHCGERAVAMQPNRSSSVTERRRDDRADRPYSFREALAYAFRGSGRMMLPGWILSLTAAATVPAFGAAIGILVQTLVPGLLFEIVRSTSEGEIELPDWPDYTDMFARWLEIVWLVTIEVVAFLPMALFFYLSDCSLLALLPGSDRSAICLGPLAGGLVAGTILGVFAFGATGTHSSGWLTFRIDLHLRALLTSAAGDGLRVAGLVALLLLASQLVSGALAGLPILGAAISAALSGYACFTGAHLVGLVFRRHRRELDLIYRD